MINKRNGIKALALLVFFALVSVTGIGCGKKTSYEADHDPDNPQILVGPVSVPHSMQQSKVVISIEPYCARCPKDPVPPPPPAPPAKEDCPVCKDCPECREQPAKAAATPPPAKPKAMRRVGPPPCQPTCIPVAPSDRKDQSNPRGGLHQPVFSDAAYHPPAEPTYDEPAASEQDPVAAVYGSARR